MVRRNRVAPLPRKGGKGDVDVVPSFPRLQAVRPRLVLGLEFRVDVEVLVVGFAVLVYLEEAPDEPRSEATS